LPVAVAQIFFPIALFCVFGLLSHDASSLSDFAPLREIRFYDCSVVLWGAALNLNARGFELKPNVWLLEDRIDT